MKLKPGEDREYRDSFSIGNYEFDLRLRVTRWPTPAEVEELTAQASREARRRVERELDFAREQADRDAVSLAEILKARGA